MQTESGAGSAGGQLIRWRDSRGHRWRIQVLWGVVNGRVECVGFAMDSDGKAAVTSQVVREAEQRIRQARTQQAKRLGRLLDEASPTGDAARRTSKARQAAWEGRSAGEQGAPRQDDKWLARAKAMRAAALAGTPLVQALRDLEPGLKESTYRKIIDRTRERDQEYGWGIVPPARRKQ